LRLGVGALEMEKAIYECGYELSNRPDWLWLPLSRLVGAG
jgi:predicted trehalose synthase